MSGRAKRPDVSTIGHTTEPMVEDALQSEDELLQFKMDQHGVPVQKDSRIDLERFIDMGEALTDEGVEWINDIEVNTGSMREWNERVKLVGERCEHNREKRIKAAEGRKKELQELLRGKAAMAAKQRAVYYEHLVRDAQDVAWTPLAPLQPQGILMTVDYPKPRPD
eukprot:TRINITY_DN627_c2_g3_i1.p2 TRINITY_DN627_c2_g3~~TRINITY_DN627_c2_g3_i1.p2  ORF type:complete len:185 (+),score=89.53 TRINITY_DN627_c2_g3_i1:58-555(+)